MTALCALLNGNNINQIAKRLNEDEDIYSSDITDIKDKQAEILKLIREVYSKLLKLWKEAPNKTGIWNDERRTMKVRIVNMRTETVCFQPVDEIWYAVAKRNPIMKDVAKTVASCGNTTVAFALITVQRFLNRTFEQLYRQHIAFTKIRETRLHCRGRQNCDPLQSLEKSEIPTFGVNVILHQCK